MREKPGGEPVLGLTTFIMESRIIQEGRREDMDIFHSVRREKHSDFTLLLDRKVV